MNAVVSYQPRDMAELLTWAERAAKSTVVPPAFRNKPADICIAVQWGWETAELTPMIALAYIDVIQGRAAYKSEALVGIALRKGYIQDVEEEFVGTPGADEYAAVCTVTKKNGKTLTRKFSVADAKKAGLYGKDNWHKWLDRMLIARARGFAVRDAAPNALLSYSAEEVHDFDGDPARQPPRNIAEDERKHLKDVTPAAGAPAAEATAEEPVLEVIQIVGADGRPRYIGSIWQECLRAYGEAKRDWGVDAGAVARANLDALKTILPFARNGTHDRLKAEIEAIEATMEAVDQPREVDEDGVVAAATVVIEGESPDPAPAEARMTAPEVRTTAPEAA